jgi:hypothetical protein
VARIRTIKPEFFLDDELASHGFGVRLLFIGLWTLADCAGRQEDRPIRIKAQLFPYEEMDVDAGLRALARTGQIKRYTVGGRGYLEVSNFLKHQRLSGKEAQVESPLPGPMEADANPSGSDKETPGSEGEATDVQEGKGREKKGKEDGEVKRRILSLTALRTQEAQEAFARVWAIWPVKRPDGHHAKGNKIPAERAFQKILDSGAATAAELEAAARAYLTNHPRVQDGFIVFVSTFYGEEKGMWMEAVRALRDRKAGAATHLKVEDIAERRA